MKLKYHLAFLSLVAMAPLLVFSGIALHDLRESEQAAHHGQVLNATRSLAGTLQRDLARAESALRVLAVSPSLAEGRFEDFRGQAMAARVAPENWIVLTDSSGRQLVNTRLRPDEPFPVNSVPPNFPQLLQAPDIVISGLIVGQVTRRQLVRLDLPVQRPNGERLLLTTALNADYFQRLLTEARFPDHWLVAIFDDKGITVARTHRAAEFVGKPGGNGILQAAASAPEGRLQTVTREGLELHDTFVKLPRLNWVVANGVRTQALEAASNQALITAMTGLGGAVLASIAIALWLGAWLSRAVGQTAVATGRMGRGDLPAMPRTYVREFDALQQQLRSTHGELLDERSARQHVEEQRQALLISEQAARQLAEQQNRSKDEFLAMLGHELRNPLGAIRSAATIAVADKARPESRSFALGVISRQSEHLARIIDDLLEVNRVLRGKIVLKLEQVQLTEVVDSVLSSLRAAGRLDRHDVAVQMQPAVVLGDRTRLEQVLSNLLSNALKFTPEGGHVAVNLQAQDGQALLQVKDAGTGMTPELLATAFDLFVQGDPPIDRSQGGLGIGLSLVRRLVQDHGGSCTASSEGLGFGSTFDVRLPLAGQPEITHSTDASLTVHAHGPCRVLVVDDLSDGRQSLAEVLRLHGHTVDEAGNGLEAVAKALDGQYDVAFVDIGLPGIDGFEVARRLRAAPGTSGLRILALTGYGEARDAALAAGFDDHLVKPVSPVQALAAVRRAAPSAASSAPQP